MMKLVSTCQCAIWLGGVLAISRTSNIPDWTNGMWGALHPSNHCVSLPLTLECLQPSSPDCFHWKLPKNTPKVGWMSILTSFIHCRCPLPYWHVEWIIEWSRIYLVRLHRQVQPGISVFHSVLWHIHVGSCHVSLCGFWWWFSLKKLSLFMFSWYLDECSSHGKWFWKAKCTVDFLALDF